MINKDQPVFSSLDLDLSPFGINATHDSGDLRLVPTAEGGIEVYSDPVGTEEHVLLGTVEDQYRHQLAQAVVDLFNVVEDCIPYTGAGVDEWGPVSQVVVINSILVALTTPENYVSVTTSTINCTFTVGDDKTGASVNFEFYPAVYGSGHRLPWTNDINRLLLLLIGVYNQNEDDVLKQTEKTGFYTDAELTWFKEAGGQLDRKTLETVVGLLRKGNNDA